MATTSSRYQSYSRDYISNQKVGMGERPSVLQSTSGKAQRASISFRQRAAQAKASIQYTQEQLASKTSGKARMQKG